MTRRTGRILTAAVAVVFALGMGACLPATAVEPEPTPPTPPAEPTLTVTPFIDLNDGDTVTVTGGGIVQTDDPAVYQCVLLAGTPTLANFDRYCDPTTRVALTSGTSFSVPFVVHRHLEVGLTGPRAPVDCTVMECDIVVGGQYITAYGEGECGSMSRFDGYGARLNFWAEPVLD